MEMEITPLLLYVAMFILVFVYCSWLAVDLIVVVYNAGKKVSAFMLFMFFGFLLIAMPVTLGVLLFIAYKAGTGG